ncbi:MAG: hypothetical protein H0T42_02725, partial [Deltaproteobacteria bacterium]|nr:hypothetical protein [Deltaproteobacteria bacterium]
MSTGRRPPTKGPTKPFLGSDDLNNELDAWDATFDALHAEDTGVAPAAQEVMEWPPPAPDATMLTVAEPAADLDLEDQMTLDRAVEDADDADDATFDPEAAPNRGSGRVGSTMIDSFGGELVEGRETDFSDVGADGPPAALGEFLGRHSTPLPIDEVDQTRVQVYPTSARRGAATQPPPLDDDDEVFTSASRPVARPPSFRDSFDDDPLAPPPPPQPEPRRGPAIIRRTPLGVPTLPARDESRTTPAHGVNLDEHTRIQEYGQLEEQRHASRPASKTAPPPIEEEDEYEIEIDASSTPAPMPSAAESHGEQSIRRTAHVVRRAEGTTKPPVTAFRSPSEDEVSIDIEAGTPVPPAGPPKEDDFSDVAAAVGANPDDPFELNLPVERPVERPVEPDAAVSSMEDAGASIDEDDERDEIPVMQNEESFAIEGPGRVMMLDEIQSSRPPALTDLYPRVKTPTSVPPIGVSPSQTLLGMPSQGGPAPQRRVSAVPTEVDAAAEAEPTLDLDAAVRAWPEQISPLASTALDESAAQALLIYER